MFIGTVYFGKNIVEQLVISATNIEPAIKKMAKYTYENYNKERIQGGTTYTCTVLDTTNLKRL